MKKKVALLLTLVMIFSLFAVGCGSNDDAEYAGTVKIGVFEPTFRFFSVHFFFLPSLIQPQHPPRKFFLQGDSAAVFIESPSYLLYRFIQYYPTFTRSSQVPYLSKVNFFCCSVSVIVTSSKLKDRFHHAFTQLLRSFSYLVLIMQCVVFSD